MRRRSKGQATVEALFALPVLLLLFMIGFQFFVITWNAQYTGVRSRYQTMSKASHRACYARDYNPIGRDTDSPVSVTQKGDPSMWQLSRDHTITSDYHVICYSP